MNQLSTFGARKRNKKRLFTARKLLAIYVRAQIAEANPKLRGKSPEIYVATLGKFVGKFTNIYCRSKLLLKEILFA
jgi:hypothetical protein